MNECISLRGVIITTIYRYTHRKMLTFPPRGCFKSCEFKNKCRRRETRKFAGSSRNCFNAASLMALVTADLCASPGTTRAHARTHAERERAQVDSLPPVFFFVGFLPVRRRRTFEARGRSDPRSLGTAVSRTEPAASGRH